MQYYSSYETTLLYTLAAGFLVPTLLGAGILLAAAVRKSGGPSRQAVLIICFIFAFNLGTLCCSNFLVLPSEKHSLPFITHRA